MYVHHRPIREPHSYTALVSWRHPLFRVCISIYPVSNYCPKIRICVRTTSDNDKRWKAIRGIATRASFSGFTNFSKDVHPVTFSKRGSGSVRGNRKASQIGNPPNEMRVSNSSLPCFTMLGWFPPDCLWWLGSLESFSRVGLGRLGVHSVVISRLLREAQADVGTRSVFPEHLAHSPVSTTAGTGFIHIYMLFLVFIFFGFTTGRPVKCTL